MVRKTNASKSATSKKKECELSFPAVRSRACPGEKGFCTSEESLGKKPVKANLHEREEEKKTKKQRVSESGRIENQPNRKCID